jgi:UPF0755 protein
MKHYAFGQKGRRSWPRIWLACFAVVLLALVVTAYLVRHNYDQHLQPVSASQRSVLVTIPSGATVQQIGNKLESQGVIRASWAFEWYVRTQDVRNSLQAGTYYLRPNQSVQDIVNVLTHGKVATDLVTILPGQRLDQVKEALVNNASFSAADVDKALDPTLYANEPALADKPSTDNLEGYLYPDSYQKTADTKPETIIRSSLQSMQKHLTPEIRAAFTKQGLTVHEGIILASIVEQEVSNPKDKPTVAQVFLLRLRQGMPLGSDVTAFYGALKAGADPSVAFDSAYNTRLHPGLPPGPISNVSDASLQAVAHPASTDYLYFVAGDDGVTYFSHTNAEHEALTAEHCKKLCQ